MRDRDIELKSGERVRLSALGRERSPRIKNLTGIILAKTRRRDVVYVLLDGNKAKHTPQELYRAAVADLAIVPSECGLC